eukprot:4543442-Pleurochrysis_carterae.AAC.2
MELDVAQLTPLGRLAAALHLDPRAAKLLALGVSFGCAPEAVVLCAAILMPRSPFRQVRCAHRSAHIAHTACAVVCVPHAPPNVHARRQMPQPKW